MVIEGSPPVYVIEITENDVLMGRGKPIISNEGNKRFRAMVRDKKEEYSSTSRTHIKEAIARSIIAEVSERKGRFLEQVQRSEANAAGYVDKTKVWKLVNVKVALNKVKQSLRDREYIKSEDRVTAVEHPMAASANPSPSAQLPLFNHPSQIPLPTAFQTGGLPPTVLPSTYIENQRRMELMQQQILFENERKAMILRAHRGLQGLQPQGLQGYNPSMPPMQQGIGLSTFRGMPQHRQGNAMFGSQEAQPPVGNNDTRIRQQQLRDFSLSHQLLVGPHLNHPASSNAMLGAGGGGYPYGIPQSLSQLQQHQQLQQLTATRMINDTSLASLAAVAPVPLSVAREEEDPGRTSFAGSEAFMGRVGSIGADTLSTDGALESNDVARIQQKGRIKSFEDHSFADEEEKQSPRFKSASASKSSYDSTSPSNEDNGSLSGEE